MNIANISHLPTHGSQGVPPHALRPTAWTADTAAAAAIEARFGLRVAALLNQSAEAAPHDVSERLRVAREQAVERARAVRKAEASATAGASVVSGRSSSGAGVLGQMGGGWWFRVASLLPLVMLVAGFVAIDDWHDRVEVVAAAEVDSALLADDLPPDAYSDPGFVEYLKTQRE